MGMAITKKRETPKHKYKGTVVCNCCNAEYSPGMWGRGFYPQNDTGASFTKLMDVPKGCCPLCGGER